MSKEENWVKMESLIENSLKKYLAKPEIPKVADPPKNGSGEQHKTLTEMLSCPNCVPDKKAFKEALHKALGEKKCTSCGEFEDEETEYCEHCGEEL